MNEFDNLNSLPQEPNTTPDPEEVSPVEPEVKPEVETDCVTEPTPVDEAAVVADGEESPAADTPAEDVAAPVAPAAPAVPAEPPKTTYRWTYADEAAHSAKRRGKGVRVYAAIMTGIFLLSFGLLLGVLLLDDADGFQGLLRPGISDSVSDEEAVVAVEQAKHSVVVIEVTTSTGGKTGTGIIMTSDGYIATNHHVIEEATYIKVTFYDGRVMEANQHFK